MSRYPTHRLDVSHERFINRYLVVLAGITLAIGWAHTANAQLLSRHQVVELDGHVLVPGTTIDALGIITRLGASRGCFIVQLPSANRPIVACDASPQPLAAGVRVRVRGKIVGTRRVRTGPFLDFLPLLRGTIQPAKQAK